MSIGFFFSFAYLPEFVYVLKTSPQNWCFQAFEAPYSYSAWTPQGLFDMNIAKVTLFTTDSPKRISCNLYFAFHSLSLEANIRCTEYFAHLMLTFVHFRIQIHQLQSIGTYNYNYNLVMFQSKEYAIYTWLSCLFIKFFKSCDFIMLHLPPYSKEYL